MRVPPRAVVLIGLATAFSLFGDSFLYAVLPSYFDELGLMPVHVGIILSVNRWVRIATNPLAEAAYRRWNMRALFVAALGLGAALTAVYAVSSSFVIILAARVVWGVCWSLIRQAGLTTVAEVSVASRLGRYMGVYNGLLRMGSFVGMLVGGIAHDAFGFTTTLLGFAVLSLVALPLGSASRAGLPDIQPTRTGHASYREHWGLMGATFASGLTGTGLVISTLGHLLQARAGDAISFGPFILGVASVTGIVLSIRWVSDLLSGPVFGALADEIGRRASAIMFFLLGAAALFAAGITGSTAGLVGCIIPMFFMNTAILVVLATEAGSRGPTAVVGFATANDAGTAVGPLIGWLVFQFGFPAEAVLFAGSISYAVGAALSLKAFPRRAAAELRI